MNNPKVREWATHWAKQSTQGKTLDPAPWVTSAYQQAVQRPPSASESRASLDFLSRQSERYRTSGAPQPELLATIDLLHTLLSLNEVIYVD
jgi:hypothetical protein